MFNIAAFTRIRENIPYPATPTILVSRIFIRKMTRRFNILKKETEISSLPKFIK